MALGAGSGGAGGLVARASSAGVLDVAGLAGGPTLTAACGTGGCGAAAVGSVGFAAEGGALTRAAGGATACGAAAGLVADSDPDVGLAEGIRRLTDGANAADCPDNDLNPASPQIVSTMAAAAATALPTNTAARFQPIDPLWTPLGGTGTLVSPQRLLSTSCIQGRRSGSFSSACMTMLSIDSGRARRRRMGAGVPLGCLATTASSVDAWDGGPPQNTS